MAYRVARKRFPQHRPQPNFRFHVRGRGEFPLDMLRYDDCHPCGEHDIAAIANGEYVHERRTITLTTDERLIHPARWASFGWAVVGCEGAQAELSGIYGVDTRDLPQVSA